MDEALTFSPGDDRLCFDVVTLPDGLLENTELFDLLLNTVDTGVFLDPSAALFSITDNNSKPMLSVTSVLVCGYQSILLVYIIMRTHTEKTRLSQACHMMVVA